jgi:agmatine deiminase
VRSQQPELQYTIAAAALAIRRAGMIAYNSGGRCLLPLPGPYTFMTDKAPALVVPAEWSAHAALWTAWPSHADLWLDDLTGARAEVATMVAALAAGDDVKVLACGPEAVDSARAALSTLAEVVPAAFGDIWLRDTGPIFAKQGDATVALRFVHNGWGGKYVLPGDATVGDSVAAVAGVRVINHDFVLEGGALEHNGAGTLLTTRQCLLNPNRNGAWTTADAEAALQAAFGGQRVLWLERGLENDHTDGHIDNLVRFVAPDAVVCQTASGDDDPNAALYAQIAADLEAMALTVHRIPSPGRVCAADDAVMPASHMNFVIGNDAVVVPTYDGGYGQQAVRALQALFPDRRVVGVASRHLLSGGGSFHCITQQQPA